MHSYRYQTGALVGEWRASAIEAMRDAVRAGQASDGEDGSGWRWSVPGSIQESPWQTNPAPPASLPFAA